MSGNLYETLGVDKKATKTQIRNAYNSLIEKVNGVQHEQCRFFCNCDSCLLMRKLLCSSAQRPTMPAMKLKQPMKMLMPY